MWKINENQPFLGDFGETFGLPDSNSGLDRVRMDTEFSRGCHLL
jgi:hypothetical protein